MYECEVWLVRRSKCEIALRIENTIEHILLNDRRSSTMLCSALECLAELECWMVCVALKNNFYWYMHNEFKLFQNDRETWFLITRRPRKHTRLIHNWNAITKLRKPGQWIFDFGPSLYRYHTRKQRHIFYTLCALVWKSIWCYLIINFWFVFRTISFSIHIMEFEIDHR